RLGKRTLPGDSGLAFECGAQRRALTFVRADQREPSIDARVEKGLGHVNEGDRALAWVHAGGEEHLGWSGRRDSRGGLGHPVAELGQRKARAGYLYELIVFLRGQTEHRAGGA